MDSGAPFIDTYETPDGKYLAVVALEEPFNQEFVSVVGIADAMPNQLRLPALVSRSLQHRKLPQLPAMLTPQRSWNHGA